MKRPTYAKLHHHIRVSFIDRCKRVAINHIGKPDTASITGNYTRAKAYGFVRLMLIEPGMRRLWNLKHPQYGYLRMPRSFTR